MDARCSGFVVTLLGLAAGCVEPAALDRRPCPCVESAWKCCALVNACVPAAKLCAEPNPGERYLPLKAGATWTYQVSEAGLWFSKTNVVEPLAPVPPPPDEAVWARQGFKVTSELKRGGQSVSRKESWQEDLGMKVVWHHERSFDAVGRLLEDEWWDPPRLRLDETPERLVSGQPWREGWKRLRVRATPGATAPTWESDWDKWLVHGEEVIEVPAGVFRCLKVERGDRLYWFARGVGKVREQNKKTASLEELLRFE